MTAAKTQDSGVAVWAFEASVFRILFNRWTNVILETKPSLFNEDILDKESAKIECGKAHFKALAVAENPAEFIRTRNIDDLMAIAYLTP
jgi:hypothetical protein